MQAKAFDGKFDSAENIADQLDLTKARRMGVTRQSLIKLWLADKSGWKSTAGDRHLCNP
jgi:hypothetical protein